MSNPDQMALIKIANALDRFEAFFTSDFVDPETGEFVKPSLAERLVDLLENPMQTVNVSAPQEPDDDFDPTFAALAGACYSMADQLDAALNMPDQFKKAKELRNLVTRIRGLADKYAENAAAEDYRHVMQSRIRRVESTHGEEEGEEGETGIRFAVQEPYEETAPQRGTESESGSGKYRAQKVWQEAHGKDERQGPKTKE